MTAGMTVTVLKKNSNLQLKTLIFKDGSVRSIWICLTARFGILQTQTTRVKCRVNHEERRKEENETPVHGVIITGS